MTNPTQPLIPRAKLFGNPTRAQGQISPDGRWLSWLAPKDGVLNIWLAPAGDIGAARPLTNDRKRGIRFHGWAYDGTHVLYMQDEGGTEDWHIYAVAIASGEVRDLTPLPGVQARMQGLSLDHPGLVVLAINDRDKAWHDLYRVELGTGKRELLFENTRELAQIVLDRQLDAAAGAQAAGQGGRPDRLPRRRQRARGDDGHRARGRPDDRPDRLHARRPHALLDLLHRPRQGGAGRHGLAERQAERAGRASQGRHQQRDRQPAHARGRGGRSRSI